MNQQPEIYVTLKLSCGECAFISAGVRQKQLYELDVRWCRKRRRYVRLDSEGCEKFEGKEGRK